VHGERFGTSFEFSCHQHVRRDWTSAGRAENKSQQKKRTYRIPLKALNFQPTIIARFGPARLVKHFDGPYELVGAVADDGAAAYN
jgi:hypothetical protein